MMAAAEVEPGGSTSASKFSLIVVSSVFVRFASAVLRAGESLLNAFTYICALITCARSAFPSWLLSRYDASGTCGRKPLTTSTCAMAYSGFVFTIFSAESTIPADTTWDSVTTLEFRRLNRFRVDSPAELDDDDDDDPPPVRDFNFAGAVRRVHCTHIFRTAAISAERSAALRLLLMAVAVIFEKKPLIFSSWSWKRAPKSGDVIVLSSVLTFNLSCEQLHPAVRPERAVGVPLSFHSETRDPSSHEAPPCRFTCAGTCTI